MSQQGRVEQVRARMGGLARGQFVGLLIEKKDATRRRMSVKLGVVDTDNERVQHMASLGYLTELDTTATDPVTGERGGIRHIHIDRIHEVVIDGLTIQIDQEGR